MTCTKILDRPFICIDCAACTNCTREYYMVTDQVWEQAHPKLTGMLCISCLEARLGRLLNRTDFTDCPLNQMTVMFEDGSPRLLNRLTNYELQL